MIKLIRTRLIQGKQYIPDIRKAAVNEPFRGFPILSSCSGCGLCAGICPSDALSFSPLSVDMGKCTFCNECARSCPDGAVSFSNNHRISTDSREKLIIKPGIRHEDFVKTAITSEKRIKKLYGRSLKLRSVSAGGCNGCEMELNACSNVNFDMGRFGIDIVASPKHADGIIITGPITENMAPALRDSYLCTPPERIVIAMGSCAISGGLFSDSAELNREFFKKIVPDLYIPGCPVHPLTFINAILDFIGVKQ